MPNAEHFHRGGSGIEDVLQCRFTPRGILSHRRGFPEQLLQSIGELLHQMLTVAQIGAYETVHS